MGLSQTITVTGLQQALDTLDKIAVFIEHGDFSGLAMDVMHQEAEQFAVSTPVTTKAHPHLRDRYTVKSLPDGSVMENLASYAALIVFRGANPHDIPNSFGWGEEIGYGPQRTPPADFWHPGFLPNEELKYLWDTAEARIGEEVQQALEALFASMLP